MILATTTVDDIDQFLAVFGEKGVSAVLLGSYRA